MYWLYQQVWAYTQGWWWGAFGSDGAFDVWDFAGLILYYEANVYASSAFVEAAVRAFFGWCNTTGCPGSAAESVLNWLGVGMESAAGRYYAVRGGKKVSDVFHQYYDRSTGAPISTEHAETAANQLRRPPASLRSGWDYIRPYWFGNISLYASTVQAHIKNNTSALWVYIPNSIEGRQFIVPSGCVWKFWLSESNLSVSCPTVRP